MNEYFSQEGYWADVWIRYIESYLIAPPRAGYWLASRFRTSLTVLEIAGGSCRDSRHLAQMGVKAVGSDFDSKTLEYLTKRYPVSPLPLQKENAFAFTFADKSFDLSFSNGFWVCFTDNKQIYSLIREQSRITKKYLISFVHNGENSSLVSRFREKSKIDSLYDIRFFTRAELHRLIQASGIDYKGISMKKFGGPIDLLLSSRIKMISNPFSKISQSVVPFLYCCQPWSMVERIACVVELD